MALATPEKASSALPFAWIKNDSRRSRKGSGALRSRTLFSIAHDGECCSPSSLHRHRFKRGEQERKFLGGSHPPSEAPGHQNPQGIFPLRKRAAGRFQRLVRKRRD